MKYASYIIIGKHKETGEYVGYVEHSFSMGIDPKRVRVERSYELRYTAEKNKTTVKRETALYMRKNVNRLNKEFSEYEWKYFRVGSKHCPFIIDWSETLAIRSKKEKYDKYKFRNLPFTVKKTDKWAKQAA